MKDKYESVNILRLFLEESDYALIMLMRLIIFMIMPLNVKCKYFVILWFGKVILKNLCLLGRDVQLEVFIL